MFVFVALYAAGWLVHVLGQAQASISSKSNGLITIDEWLKLNKYVLLVRLFLAAMTFLLWKESPDIFGGLLGRTIPMTKALCGLFGFGVDEIWNKLVFIAGLRVEIPNLVPNGQNGVTK